MMTTTTGLFPVPVHGAKLPLLNSANQTNIFHGLFYLYGRIFYILKKKIEGQFSKSLCFENLRLFEYLQMYFTY